MNGRGRDRWRCGVAALALLAAGCGRPDPAQRPERPGQVLDFDTLFTQNCIGCHGRDGRSGPAPPLNDPLFLAIIPDSEITMAIGGGREGTLMPPFGRDNGGPLTSKQVDVLAGGIRQRWAGSPPGKPLPDYAAQEGGDAKAGREVFNQTCARCHGRDGEGIEKKAGALNDRAFLALVSNQILRRITICGRPDLPGGCPDYRHEYEGEKARPLKAEEITNIVALLASWRRGPDPAAE